MAKTITRSAGSVQDWLDQLDPATTPASDAADLRRVGVALQACDAAKNKSTTAERALASAVKIARNDGHSWSTIGMVLGVSRQAAQQRFREAAAIYQQ
ncbi:MAG: hypothetical protein ACRDPW_10065 [Mycobacteriales bacterium]